MEYQPSTETREDNTAPGQPSIQDAAAICGSDNAIATAGNPSFVPSKAEQSGSRKNTT